MPSSTARSEDIPVKTPVSMGKSDSTQLDLRQAFQKPRQSNFADWCICGCSQLYMYIILTAIQHRIKCTALRYSQEIKQNRAIIQGITL